MTIYYVYAYLRSKDSKTAKAGTPYYIGKGSGNRAWDKSHSVNLPRQSSYIVIMESGLTELGAFALERRYISWYGRKDNKHNPGILHNKTDGGDGMSSDDAKKLAVARVSAGTHNFQKRKDGTSVQTDRVVARTHPFQKREDGSSIASDKVLNGTHPFLGGGISSKTQQKLIAEGKHHLQQTGPNHPKYDHAVYYLENVITLEIVSGTRQYLVKITQLNDDKLSKLIRGKRKTTHEWRLHSPNNL
jgi:hypothetical protein